VEEVHLVYYYAEDVEVFVYFAGDEVAAGGVHGVEGCYFGEVGCVIKSLVLFP